MAIQGIAFRSVIAYVTDVSPDYCENSDTDLDSGNVNAATYPQVTPQGFNVGWETVQAGSILTRDRNTANARLAGYHGNLTASEIHTYRIDITPGIKIIRLACGDYTYGGRVSNIELFDGTTSLGVLASATTTGAQRFIDATNTERTSAADWVTNNASVTKTFATSILRFKMGDGAAGGGAVAFFYVEDAGAAAIALQESEWNPLEPQTNPLTISRW